MTRSRINPVVDAAIRLLNSCRVHLPTFDLGLLPTARPRGAEIRQVVERKLGSDVTEFELGRFEDVGIVQFTLRDGFLDDLDSTGKCTRQE